MAKMKCNKGTAAVEFALVLPLLVLLVFGIIEISVLLYDRVVLTNAVREGARAGIVYETDVTGQNNRRSDDVIRSVVNDYCRDRLITFGSSSESPNIPDPEDFVQTINGEDVNFLRVVVGYHYEFLVLPNFITNLIGGIDLRAETVMMTEYQPGA